MKTKKITYGLLFILLAVYLITSRLDIVPMPRIPVFKILVSVVLVAIIIQGIRKLDFFSIFMPLALIAWQYDEYLGITAITPWIVILAAFLLTIGCDCLFHDQKKKYKRWKVSKGHNGVHFDFGPGSSSTEGEAINCSYSKETKDDGEYVYVDNAIGDTTRYVDSDSFKFAKIDNGIGKCVVYFSNAIVKDGKAAINIDNGVGRIEVYIPANWRIQMKTDNGLGHINLVGETSKDENDPLVEVSIDNGLGNVDVIVL